MAHDISMWGKIRFFNKDRYGISLESPTLLRLTACKPKATLMVEWNKVSTSRAYNNQEEASNDAYQLMGSLIFLAAELVLALLTSGLSLVIMYYLPAMKLALTESNQKDYYSGIKVAMYEGFTASLEDFLTPFISLVGLLTRPVQPPARGLQQLGNAFQQLCNAGEDAEIVIETAATTFAFC